MSNRKAVVAAAVGAVLAGGGLARGALVGQWIGDNYAGGNSWNDSSGAGSNATVITGVMAPTTTAGVFNGHKAVNFPGGAGANAPGWFSVPDTASNALGATALSWIGVFKTSATNISDGAQFWQKAGLIGKEEGGATTDWGFGVGAANATVGVGTPDTTITSSGAVNDGATHVVAATWDGSGATGTLTLYVDGVQAAQNTAAPAGARVANTSGAFALGAMTALNNGDTRVFNGQVAELRLYNDLQSPAQIAATSTALRTTYVGIPEPTSIGLLAVGGLGLLVRRRRAAR